MSDVSVLSHEYKTVAELSQALSHALITVKRVRLALPGADNVTSMEFAACKSDLASILEAFASLLDPASTGKIDSAAAARIPGALVERLRTERGGDLQYFIDDLTGAASRLRGTTNGLTEKDIQVIGQLAGTVDSQTSTVYRRLMRK
jgi:hypothetical protein